jgi:hypothetical protein
MDASPHPRYILVKSKEITGRSKTLPWWLRGSRVKDDRHQNTLTGYTLCSACYLMGLWIGAMDPAIWWAAGQMSWILLGQRIGALDVATQWAGGYVRWILLMLSNGLADSRRGSCYTMGWQRGADDPASQWIGRQLAWILMLMGGE